MNAITLSPPRNLSTSRIGGNIQLTWTAPATLPTGVNASQISYRVYRRLNNGSFTPIVATGANVLTFTDTTVQTVDPNVYTYYAKATFGIFESVQSDFVHEDFRAITASPPRNLRYAIDDNVDSVILSWDAPIPVTVGNFSHYRVFRNNVEVSPSNYQGITWTDTNPHPIESNIYYVIAEYVNPNRDPSVPSNFVEVNFFYTIEKTNDPLAPVFVQVKRTPLGFEISWEKPLLANPDGYVIYEARSGVGQTPITTTTPLQIGAGQRRFIHTVPFEAGEIYRIYGVQAYYNGITGGERSTGSSYSNTLNNDRTVSTSHSVNANVSYQFSIESGIDVEVFSLKKTHSFGVSAGYGHEWGESNTVGTAITNETNQSQSINWSRDMLPSEIQRAIVFNSSFNEPQNVHLGQQNIAYSDEIFIRWQEPIFNAIAGSPRAYQVYRDGVPVPTGRISHHDGQEFFEFADNISSSHLIIGLDYTYHVTAIFDTETGNRESKPSLRVRAYTFGGTQPPGTGHETTPYLISTPEHLYWLSEYAQIRNNTPGWAPGNIATPIFVRQVGHIEAGPSMWKHNFWIDGQRVQRGFRPIGHSPEQSHSDLRFRGVFDAGIYDDGCPDTGVPMGEVGCYLTGNLIGSFEIRNLYIDASGYALFPTGLFSSVVGAESEIRNVHLVNATIRGGSVVGGIVGELAGGAKILNSSVNGNSVVFGYECVGGIVGYAGPGSQIERCYTEGTVIGSIAGGLAGTIRTGHIRESYSIANVFGGYIGGLAGVKKNTSIYDSYFGGMVEDNEDGLGGKIAGAAFMLLENLPDVAGNTVSNVFWTEHENIEGFGEVTNEILAASSMSKTAEEMRDLETFTDAGWNMDIWGVCPSNNGLPHFKSRHQCTHNPPLAIRLSGITTTGHLELTWNSPWPGSCGTLTGYSVLRNDVEIGFTTDNSFVDISAENGTLNTYHVVAVYENATGEAISLPLELPTFLRPMLQTTSIEHCSVTLSWQFSVPTPTRDNSTESSRRYSTDGSRFMRELSSYQIYFGEEMIAEVSENTFTHNSSHATFPLICGTPSSNYMILAIFTDPDGESVSNEVQVNIPTNHHFVAPTSLMVSGVASGQISLSWTAPTENHCGTLTNYSVYFGTDNPPNTNFMTTTETNMTIPGLANGTTYFFVVRANYVDHTGTSANSNMVFASPDPTSDIDMSVVPAHTELLANYPNPFNPETVIRFSVGNHTPSASSHPSDRGELNVRIDVYNVKGQRVRALFDGYVSAGYHQVVWDGTDDLGRDVSSGIYFYRMNAGEYSSIRKMLLMK